MKVTFPHMGNLSIALQALLEGLNLEVIPPPPISKRTFELGIKYSPEFACMPLKINVGNFIEALEQGADTIVMAGGWGPCRFGYYAQVERDILSDLGYEFQIIILEAPDSKTSELIKQVKSMGENVSLKEAVLAIKFAWDKLNATENLERMLEYYLPRVRNKEEVEKNYEQAIEKLFLADNKRRVLQIPKEFGTQMKQLPREAQEPLRIGLVGEIYTILEPAANYNISKELGRMNCEVQRSIYLTDWLNDHLLGGFVKKSNKKRMTRLAKPYLNYWVGGHGLETVGCTVDLARQHFDGVIQIGPLTCMPEIVAQSILPYVSQCERIPVMTLWFDELSGTAGILTRLEAFVDMIRRQQGQQLLKEAQA